MRSPRISARLVPEPVRRIFRTTVEFLPMAVPRVQMLTGSGRIARLGDGPCPCALRERVIEVRKRRRIAVFTKVAHAPTTRE